MQASEDVRSALVAGYLDTDGCLQEDGLYVFSQCLAHRPILEDAREIAIGLGIRCSVICDVSDNGVVSSQPQLSVASPLDGATVKQPASSSLEDAVKTIHLTHDISLLCWDAARRKTIKTADFVTSFDLALNEPPGNGALIAWRSGSEVEVGRIRRKGSSGPCTLHWTEHFKEFVENTAKKWAAIRALLVQDGFIREEDLEQALERIPSTVPVTRNDHSYKGAATLQAIPAFEDLPSLANTTMPLYYSWIQYDVMRCKIRVREVKVELPLNLKWVGLDLDEKKSPNVITFDRADIAQLYPDHSKEKLKTSLKVWIEVKGTGIKRKEDLSVRLSRDKKNWIDAHLSKTALDNKWGAVKAKKAVEAELIGGVVSLPDELLPCHCVP